MNPELISYEFFDGYILDGFCSYCLHKITKDSFGDFCPNENCGSINGINRDLKDFQSNKKLKSSSLHGDLQQKRCANCYWVLERDSFGDFCPNESCGSNFIL